jgi:hypothetical protein
MRIKAFNPTEESRTEREPLLGNEDEDEDEVEADAAEEPDKASTETEDIEECPQVVELREERLRLAGWEPLLGSEDEEEAEAVAEADEDENEAEDLSEESQKKEKAYKKAWEGYIDYFLHASVPVHASEENPKSAPTEFEPAQARSQAQDEEVDAGGASTEVDLEEGKPTVELLPGLTPYLLPAPPGFGTPEESEADGAMETSVAQEETLEEAEVGFAGRHGRGGL